MAYGLTRKNKGFGADPTELLIQQVELNWTLQQVTFHTWYLFSYLLIT